jgi:hypothetical protein
VLEALDALDAADATVTFHPDWRERFDGEGETEPAVVVPVAPRRGLVAVVIALAALVIGGGAYLLLAGRSGDGESSAPATTIPPASPDEVLSEVHAAIRDRDFAAFAACFEPGVLEERLGDPPRDAFLAGAANLSDFEFLARLPMMVGGSVEETARVVTSPALTALFGFESGPPLWVAFRQSSEGSLISEIEEARPPRRGPGPPGDRNGRDGRNAGRMVRQIFDRLGDHAPELLRRMADRGLLPEEKIAPALERLRETLAKGPLDVEILEGGTRMGPQGLEVTVRSRGLARIVDSGKDRFVLHFGRSRGDRRWRFTGMSFADE